VALALQLLVVLGDGYPSVRVLAQRSLRALDAELELGLAQDLLSYDPLAAPQERTARLLELLERVPPRLRVHLASDLTPLLLSADGRPDLQRIRALLELQSDHVISIGE
jgi:hypothetical protein